MSSAPGPDRTDDLRFRKAQANRTSPKRSRAVGPLAGLLAIALLAGCTKHEYSATKKEPATVSDLVYSPATHGTGVGYDLSGKGGISIVSVDTEPRHAVVFECPHGRFVVEHNQERATELFGRLHRGDRVVISYRDIYEIQKNGRHLVGFDFLDAQRVLPDGPGDGWTSLPELGAP